MTLKSKTIVENQNCPYMDSINRKSLDFDFEKICSVTLTRQNVYACLVCGLFLKGRSKSTPAYFHSINNNHHLFLHLSTEKVFCLPDDYLVDDPSLSDIKHALNPKYNDDEIKTILYNEKYSTSLEGNTFIPGKIGINNLGNTDSYNSVLQSLFSVRPLVKFFMKTENYLEYRSKLLDSFGQLVRKFYNPSNFKGQISPQEFMQIVDEVSDGRFKIGKSCDSVDMLIWLVNELHLILKSKNSNNQSIITDVFRGLLFKEIIKIKPTKRKMFDEITSMKIPSPRIQPFFFLSLDLPPTPLYRGEDVEEFIPQVPINDLIRKFDGNTIIEDSTGTNKYSVWNFPPYLILHIRRFIKNDFRPEKNPTIVNFPVKNLEMREIFRKTNKETLSHKTKQNLIDIIKSRKLYYPENIINSTNQKLNNLSKDRLIIEIIKRENLPIKYDLVSNIVHQGDSKDKGYTKAYVLHCANKKWYETQDLSIQETMAQLVTVAESYVQIWKRCE